MIDISNIPEHQFKINYEEGRKLLKRVKSLPDLDRQVTVMTELSFYTWLIDSGKISHSNNDIRKMERSDMTVLAKDWPIEWSEITENVEKLLFFVCAVVASINAQSEKGSGEGLSDTMDATMAMLCLAPIVTFTYAFDYHNRAVGDESDPVATLMRNFQFVNSLAEQFGTLTPQIMKQSAQILIIADARSRGIAPDDE